MGEDRYTYDQLLKRYGEQKFRERFCYIKTKADEFIDQSGYSGLVECNDRILMHVIIDYFSDIDRLKEFHNIERIKTDKIAAYLIAWFLRRKPLQFTKLDYEERDIFINERFALFYMLNECMITGDVPVLSEQDLSVFDEYLNLVLYYFKYRECNPQVIELLIESFKIGCFVSRHDLQR